MRTLRRQSAGLMLAFILPATGIGDMQSTTQTLSANVSPYGKSARPVRVQVIGDSTVDMAAAIHELDEVAVALGIARGSYDFLKPNSVEVHADFLRSGLAAAAKPSPKPSRVRVPGSGIVKGSEAKVIAADPLVKHLRGGNFHDVHGRHEAARSLSVLKTEVFEIARYCLS